MDGMCAATWTVWYWQRIKTETLFIKEQRIYTINNHNNYKPIQQSSLSLAWYII